MKKLNLYFLLICFVFSCQDDGSTIHETIMDDTFTGTWLLVEYGYSPGGGYITKDVPEDPPQTIQLASDLSVSTNIEGLTKYKFYRVLYDSVHQLQVVAFFEASPRNEPSDISTLDHSYSASWDDGSLKLAYRWCIEGCHYRFRKIGGAPAE